MGRLEYNEHAGRPVMSDRLTEFTTVQVMPDTQKRAIVGLADIRRRSQILSAQLDSITQNTTRLEASENLRTTCQKQANLVREIMRSDTEPIKDSKDIDSHLSMAFSCKDTAPSLAALHFAKAVLQQQATNADYLKTLEQAKTCLDVAEKKGIPKTTPADFLPDAYILKIAKRAMRDVALPSVAEVAETILHEPSLIKDYALVLPESDREEFLATFPQSERPKVSLQLDRAASEVLNKKLISAPNDIEQRDAIKSRVSQAFQEAIAALKTPDYRENRGDSGRSLGSRWSARQITETLVSLGEEDSLRIIRDIAERSTREVKGLNKEIRKKPLNQRVQALQPFLSFVARVLNTLIDVDVKRGGVLTMRYLEMSALPDRLFSFFAKKLVKKGYFTKNLSPFIDNNNVPVLKKLMAKYGPQFNTIVDTLEQTSGYKEDHRLYPREAELFEALGDLETLTPRIFERYRKLPRAERKDFAEKIRIIKPLFFRNAPIKGIIGSSDQDILAEMVYVAYKPMGMSFEQVSKLIREVGDHTDDLSQYVFPQEGYSLTLEKQGRHIIKEKQQIDLDSIRGFRNLFVSSQIRATNEATEPTPFASAFRSLLQPESQISDVGQVKQDENNILNSLLLPLQGQTRVQEFLARSTSVNTDNAYQIASELAEITGVYFRDNYGSTLTEYLDSHPGELRGVLSLLGNTEIQSTISERLRQFNTGADWQELNRAAASGQGLLRRVFSRSSGAKPQDVASKIIAQLIELDQMQPIRKNLESELSKFTLASDVGPAYLGKLKAYMSKNVGSFFAKAAAGICTAEDIPLFERSDHFHINIVENDEAVRANIQAYVESVKGKPSLILRGFNPTADWVGKIDIENFCEQILTIGKQFQRDNGLDAVYITEQGSWHALSNRDQVARYLVKRYHEGKPAVQFTLKVASSSTVSTIYKI